ncbi:MAG: sulfite exporter TauE/SafE family protein [Eggerthellaceae bacterium]|nr:sulfite exporter TauE/SafE family protein [Eggerthellaceae bacterium]
MALFLLSICVGFGVGVLSGMLGIGGGMVMLPVFRLGFGMATLQATATSLFAIVPTSLAGSATHLRNRTCVPAVGVLAGIGGACSSPVGVYLASASPTWLVMAAAALVIGYSSVTMLKKALAIPKKAGEDGCAPAVGGRADAARSRPGDCGNAPSGGDGAHAGDLRVSGEGPASLGLGVLPRACAIGLVAGVASGYIGVGGGFVMIPLFASLLGLGMKKASGTSLIAVSILAIPGVIEQFLLGNVMVSAGVAMAIGSIPGAVVGSALSKRVPERQLRFLFSGMLFVSAALLVAKELGI